MKSTRTRNKRLNGDKRQNSAVTRPVDVVQSRPATAPSSPAHAGQPMNVCWDMETGDPDDILTMLMLLGHPSVALRAITLAPGSHDQVGFVRALLRRCGREDIPVGGLLVDSHPDKDRVGLGHPRKFQVDFVREAPDTSASQVLSQAIQQYPDATIITGAPLGNIEKLLEEHPDVRLERIVMQGGFAGTRCVAKPMKKFKGMQVCPTWNFGGNPKAARMVLDCDRINRKLCISKDVCHAVTLHSGLRKELLARNVDDSIPHQIFNQWIVFDQERRREDKKLHDPLAAATAINEACVTLMEVQVERNKGKWGSYPCAGTNVFISVAYDREKFEAVLLGEC